MKKIAFLFISTILFSCVLKPVYIYPKNLPYEEFHFFDTSRNRDIPVAIFYKKGALEKNSPLLIFSHGYGKNEPKSNLAYNYLLENIASQGFVVCSIQHELSTDDLLPLTGNPQILRLPNWQRGAENINFVLQKFKKKYPNLNYNKVVISGHSNGGDMSVLFAEKHPAEVWKLITLDQRRYAFPLLTKPKIYSLRSSDQPADQGVIPSEKDQKKYGITIIKLPATIHNDMDESGTEIQRKEIISYFTQFLKDR